MVTSVGWRKDRCVEGVGRLEAWTTWSWDLFVSSKAAQAYSYNCFLCLITGLTSWVGDEVVREDPVHDHAFRSCSQHIPCCCCCWVASVMFDSVRPHRQQPTRLLCPWDSLGKNTGVGCHFLLRTILQIHVNWICKYICNVYFFGYSDWALNIASGLQGHSSIPGLETLIRAGTANFFPLATSFLDRSCDWWVSEWGCQARENVKRPSLFIFSHLSSISSSSW